jgi:RNA polymerase sigma-70 factor (ECF subfamily)
MMALKAEPALVDGQDQLARFERSIMPHLDAVYNLARWLTLRDPDAQAVVQDAYLRAFRLFNRCRGDSRCWLLGIVCKVVYDWLKQNRGERTVTLFDERLHDPPEKKGTPDPLLLAKADHEALRRAIAELPVQFRELLILHELEGLSYKEIANVARVPLRTVMPRLARAREHLLRTLLVPPLHSNELPGDRKSHSGHRHLPKSPQTAETENHAS